jgi:hypothetical protein
MYIDTIRQNFSESYRTWVTEGSRLRNLLEAHSESELLDPKALLEQQKRVTQAKETYEAAEQQYVRCVLGD